MFERLAELEAEYEALEARLADVFASGDQAAAREAGRRHAELRPVVEHFRAYRRAKEELDDAHELLVAEADAEMREFLRGEVEARTLELDELSEQLQALLQPTDPNAGRNVILEIRGAEGGEEGNLWARDLFQMYDAYARRHNWKVDVISSQPSDLGGLREVAVVVKGPDAWARLKHEAGPHRVQRVPVTESQGRVHTSAATVIVLPEAEEVDIEVDPNDLQIDVYRSSGPGGQSVNTTDSAVRITHKPTGIVVSCQDQKSQLQNKEQAMRVLRSRLFQAQQERQEAELSNARRTQVKSGGRSDKVRTYNYKDNRVTDHRVGLTVKALDRVLAGEEELDELVDALIAQAHAEELVGGPASS